MTPDEPSRVSEILVNKRIYALARPLWFSRLTIAEDQLDCRLTGLLGHEQRREDLRNLELSLVPAHANLANFTIARIPHLTHFSVRITSTGASAESLHDTLEGAISSLGTIRHLTSHIDGSNEIHGRVELRLVDPRYLSLCSLAVYDNSRVAYKDRFDDGWLVESQVSDVPVEVYQKLRWGELERCTCGPVSEQVETDPPIVGFLNGLAAALEEDKVRGLSFYGLCKGSSSFSLIGRRMESLLRSPWFG